MLDVPAGVGFISVRNPNRAHSPMNLHIYNPEIRAKAISNQESAAKAMSLNGRLSTPQFELELEAALVKANPPPKHHTSEIAGKLTKIHT